MNTIFKSSKVGVMCLVASVFYGALKANSIDLFAHALREISIPNLPLLQKKIESDGVSHILNMDFPDTIFDKSLLKNDPCGQLKQWKQNLIGMVSKSDKEVFVGKRHPEKMIADISALLLELECEKVVPLDIGNYQLGPELVKQKFAVDISNQFKNIDQSKTKFYHIALEKQKGAECMYCSVNSAIYMIYAFTQPNVNDAVKVLENNLCIGSVCPVDKLQKVSKQIFDLPPTWLDEAQKNLLCSAIPYREKFQAVFSGIKPELLEKIMGNLFQAEAFKSSHILTSVNELKVSDYGDNIKPLPLKQPHAYTSASINTANIVVAPENLFLQWRESRAGLPTFIQLFPLLLTKPNVIAVSYFHKDNKHAWTVVAHTTTSLVEYFVLDSLSNTTNADHLLSLQYLQSLIEADMTQVFELAVYMTNPASIASRNEKLSKGNDDIDYFLKHKFKNLELFKNEPDLKKAYDKIK